MKVYSGDEIYKEILEYGDSKEQHELSDVKFVKLDDVVIQCIKLIGKIGNELMEERKTVSEKIIVQQTISRLVIRIDKEK